MRNKGLTQGLIVLLSLLIAGFAFGQDWTYDFGFASGDREDTTSLTIGVDYRATDLYDAGIDIVFPVAPPSGLYAFCPLDDPDYPGFTMLRQDIRNSEEAEITWTINVNGDFSEGSRVIYWNYETLPLFTTETVGEMHIGANFPGLEITEWVDMSDSTISEFEFASGMEIEIHVLMAAGIDEMGPEVTWSWPPEGATGVSRITPIEFHIQDDLSGVDSSTLVLMVNDEVIPHDDFIDFDPMPFGYYVSYIPTTDWPETTTICASIYAEDLWVPAHGMDTFVYCFTTPAEPPDTYPPYFEDAEPSDNDTTVLITEHLRIKVRDTERGVDESSVSVTINDLDYTAFELVPIDGFLYDYSVDIAPPMDGWAERSWYYVCVHACDRATPTNCIDTCYMFRTLDAGEAPMWDFEVIAWSTEGHADTAANPLYFGTDPDADEYYNTGFDIPSPSPSFATFGYFPLVDPTSPLTDKLQKDIRRNDHTVTWEVEYNNPFDLTGLSWDRDAIVELAESLSGEFRIGSGPTLGELSWIDMSSYDGREFDPTDYVFIRFTDITEDTIAPIVLHANPRAGATDVSIATDIEFDIVDPGSGVDISSFQLFVWRDGGSMIEIDETEWTSTLVADGYRISYDPAVNLDRTSVYHVRVMVSDLASPENDANIEWTFTTVSTDLPIIDPFCLDVINVSDESVSPVCLGTNSDALIGRDDYDVPIPILPPSGFTAYFPIEDVIYNYLTTDVRPRSAGPQVWHVMSNGGTGSYRIEWNLLDIPGDHTSEYQFYMAFGTPGDLTPPSDEDFYMLNMLDTNMVSFDASQEAWIKLMPPAGGEDFFCISGVVDLYGDDESTTARVTVDETHSTSITPAGGGEFTICGLEAGTYHIIFEAEGYVTDTQLVVIIDDDIEMEEVELRPPGVLVHGTVSLEGEARHSISVTLETAGLSITNTEGYYQFEDVMPADSLEICFTNFPPGYPDTCWLINVPESVEEVVIDFNYTVPPLSVTGIVSLDGTPVEGASIAFCDDPETVVATTDDTGAYFVDGLSLGMYCFIASYPGYDPVDASLYVTNDTTLNFDLIPGDVVISGTITSDCGDEVDGILVRNDGVADDVLSIDGSYEFDPMTWGTYTISTQLEYFARVDTTVEVDADMVVDIVVPCLLPVTDFVVSPNVYTRPLADGEVLGNVCSWTLPTTSLTIQELILHRTGGAVGHIIIDTLDADVVEYLDETVENGTTYEYWMVVRYEVPAPYNYSPESDHDFGASHIYGDDNQILIIDYDNGATPIDGDGCEEAMANLLDSPALGLDPAYGYTITDQDPDDLDGYDLNDYEFIIVELGIDDGTDADLPTHICDELIDYAEVHGKNIYVEGPDFGEHYGAGTGSLRNFFNLFGISFPAGGGGNDETMGNVDVLRGNYDFFGRRLSADYAYQTLADRSIDNFNVTSAVVALRDQSDLVRATVNTVATDKRIASSIYVAAIGDDLLDNAAERILGEYLDAARIPNDAIAEEVTIVTPEAFAISSVTPNPFNPATSIEYKVSETSEVILGVYDINGNLVKELVNTVKDAGTYTTSFNGEGLATGSYLVRLDVNGVSTATKIILMK